MPVEIKKLIIKAVVDSSGTYNEQLPQQNTEGQTTGNQNFDYDMVIKSCVKEVMQIFKQTKQR